MTDNDLVASPSAVGILRCLQLLAEEASLLNLPRTFAAIEDAVETAIRERGASGLDDPRRPASHLAIH